MGGSMVYAKRLSYKLLNLLRRYFHKPEKLVGSYLTEGMTVMDLGCGRGDFSIGMAQIVGAEGCVISIDIRREMLDILQNRAGRAKLASRIRTHHCDLNKIRTMSNIDFVLAFWVVHELSDFQYFFTQLRSSLNSKGRILLIEPLFHVNSFRFEDILESARIANLRLCGRPHVAFSRAALFETASGA